MIKSYFKHIQKSDEGMSILETLVGTAFVGLIILFGMKQSQMMGQSKLEAKTDRDIIEWHGELIEVLSKAQTCNANFLNKNIDHDFQELVDENNAPLFKEHAGNNDNLILNNQVKVINIYTQLENNQIVLNIDIEKVRERIRTKTLTKKIHLLADLNAGVIQNCFSFEEGAANTVEYLIAKNLCEQIYGVGTPEFHANFDPIARTCNFSGFFADTNCPNGQVITAITLNAQGDHVASCSAPYTPSTCPNSWVQSVDAQGNFNCVDLSALVNPTVVNFSTGQSCHLGIVNNFIQLVCNGSSESGATSVGECSNLPVSSQCGPSIINEVDYSHCTNLPILCACLSGPAICVTSAQACTDLGGCL